MNRQMFAQGGFVRPMQEGGIASMQLMPQAAPAPDPAMMGGMPPDPAMMGGMPPEGMSMEQAAQGAMDQGLDPAMLEQGLGDYQQGMDNLDNAQDYESAINAIRGDQLPIDARYQELAGMVGPEDATATPESVLTLIQPVMQMAAVDQGIGGLAQDEMMAPIEGPMAEGIMSTVNMGPAEGPAPVNFSQGGAVQYMDNGGPVQYMEHGGTFHYELDNTTVPQKTTAATLTLDNAISGDSKELKRQKELFENRRQLQRTLLGSGDNEAAFEEQKNLTQAQMLFDVAQGALAFASPGDRQMSPAERLAQSFSPVLGNIGVRAGELGKFKQAQDAEDRAMDLSALTASQALYNTELAAQVAAAAQIKAEAAATAAAQTKARAAVTAAKVKSDRQLAGGGNSLTVTYGNEDGPMKQATDIFTVGQLNALRDQYSIFETEKPTTGKLINTVYDLTFTDPKTGEEMVEKGRLFTDKRIKEIQTKYPDAKFAPVTKDSAPTFDTLYFPGTDRPPQQFEVGSENYLNAITSIEDGGDGGISDAPSKESMANQKLVEKVLKVDVTIPDENGDPKTYLAGTTLNLSNAEMLLIPRDSYTAYTASKDGITRTQKTLIKNVTIPDGNGNEVQFKAGEHPNLTAIQLSNIPETSYKNYEPDGGPTNISITTFENSLDSNDRRSIRSDNEVDINKALEDGFHEITTQSASNDPQASRVVKILSNSDSITRFGSGEMQGTELNEFVQTILTAQLPSRRPINGRMVEFDGFPLNMALVNALRAREELGLPTTGIKIPPMPETVSEAQAALIAAHEEHGILSSQAEQVLLSIVSPKTGKVNRKILASPEFNQMLLHDSGYVNLDAPAWLTIPTSTYEIGGDYDLAQGLETIPARIAATLRELRSGALDSDRKNENDQFLYQADNDFNTLRLRTLTALQTTLAPGRILQQTNKLILSTINSLVPGVMKFDANTLTSIRSINKLLGSELTKQAQVLLQYGGDPKRFSDARIQEAEDTAFQLRGLMAEFIQLERGMNAYLADETGLGKTPNNEKKNTLYEIFQNPQNFVGPSK